MRILLTTLFFIFLLVCTESCRKPNYTYHDPCSDSTFLALKAQEPSLNARDHERLEGFRKVCEEYQAENDNRGKLWPYILGGVVVVAGAIAAYFWLFYDEGTVYN